MNKFKEKLYELKSRLAVRKDCVEESEILESILKEESQCVVIPMSKFLSGISYKTEKDHLIKGCARRLIGFKAYSEITTIAEGLMKNKDVVDSIDKELRQALIAFLESEK